MKIMEAVLDSKLYWKLPFWMQKKIANLLAFLLTAGVSSKELFGMWWKNGGREKATAIILDKLSEEFPEAEFE